MYLEKSIFLCESTGSVALIFRVIFHHNLLSLISHIKVFDLLNFSGSNILKSFKVFEFEEVNNNLFHQSESTDSVIHIVCSLGFWQSFVTIRSCNHLMRIISRYVVNTKKSEIS